MSETPLYVPPDLTISTVQASLDASMSIRDPKARGEAFVLSAPDAQLWMPRDVAAVTGRTIRVRLEAGTDAALAWLCQDLAEAGARVRGGGGASPRDEGDSGKAVEGAGSGEESRGGRGAEREVSALGGERERGQRTVRIMGRHHVA